MVKHLEEALTLIDMSGILGGMYVFDPDRERSVLGVGAWQRFAVKELSNIVNDEGERDEEGMNVVISEVRKMGAVKSEFILRYVTSCCASPRTGFTS